MYFELWLWTVVHAAPSNLSGPIGSRMIVYFAGFNFMECVSVMLVSSLAPFWCLACTATDAGRMPIETAIHHSEFSYRADFPGQSAKVQHSKFHCLEKVLLCKLNADQFLVLVHTVPITRSGINWEENVNWCGNVWNNNKMAGRSTVFIAPILINNNYRPRHCTECPHSPQSSAQLKGRDTPTPGSSSGPSLTAVDTYWYLSGVSSY